MVLNRLAAVGLGVVAAMHLLFVLTGLASPTFGTALSAVGLVGALACAWGLWTLPARSGVSALAGGLAALLAVRATYLGRGLDDVGFDDVGGFLSVGGFALALLHAAWWAAAPGTAPARASGVRVGLGLAAAGYFATMVTVTSSGSLVTMLGLLLGAVGFSLAAPNVFGEDAPASPAEPRDAQRA